MTLTRMAAAITCLNMLRTAWLIPQCTDPEDFRGCQGDLQRVNEENVPLVMGK